MKYSTEEIEKKNIFSMPYNEVLNAFFGKQLAAINDEGQSKLSDVVNYRTKPDRPLPPPKPQIKGKIHANSFRVVWGKFTVVTYNTKPDGPLPPPKPQIKGKIHVNSFRVVWGKFTVVSPIGHCRLPNLKSRARSMLIASGSSGVS